MTVRVPVSADASRAVSEMERFATAIRRTGQEGRKFAELDFSHPEMKAFADRMQEAQRRFEEMVKAGRGATADELRRGVRGGRYGDVLGWWYHTPQQFPNPLLRERHTTNVMSGLFSGTPLQPVLPGQHQPSGGQSQSGGGGALSSSIGSLLRWALPLMGLAKVGSMAAQGIGDAAEEAADVSALRRSMGALSTDFEAFRDHVRQAGEGLGVTYQETVRLARSFTQASGQVEEGAAFGNTRTAIGFARSFGLDPSQVVGRFGRAQWLQVGGKNADAKELARLFADAIAAGGMFAKADLVMDAITNWVESSERIMIDAPNAREYAALQAQMNASGRPGLQGTAGAAVLAQIDAAIRAGGAGAGEAGQVFMYNTLARLGVRDPFQQSYLLERGAFGDALSAFGRKDAQGAYLPDDVARYKDKTVLDATMEGLRGYHANPYIRANAGGRLLGISQHAYRALEDLDPDKRKALFDASRRYDFDPAKLDATAMLDVVQIKGMGLNDLKQRRDHILKTRGGELTTEQRAALATNDEGKLREELIRVVSGLGMEKDVGRRMHDTTVEIKNQITKLADGGLGLLTDIKGLIAQGFGLVNDAVEPRPPQTNPAARGFNESRQRLRDLGWREGALDSSAASSQDLKVLQEFGPKLAPGTVPGATAPGQNVTVKIEAAPIEVIDRNAAGAEVGRRKVPMSVVETPGARR